MDLLWALAKSKLVDPKMPSDIRYEKKEDTRTAEQIIADVLDNMGR